MILAVRPQGVGSALLQKPGNTDYRCKESIMFGARSLLSAEATFIFSICTGLMLWSCFLLVGWSNPFRWVAMWLALLALGFIAGSTSGPIAYGRVMGGSPSNHLWDPSLVNFGFAIAIASAGTIGVWRSNRQS